jgi:hypothetical protein
MQAPSDESTTLAPEMLVIVKSVMSPMGDITVFFEILAI